MTIIQSIKLSESFSPYLDTNKNRLECIEPISNINIFVGANNTGKSRFLRLLSVEKEYNVDYLTVNTKEVNQNLKAIIDDLLREMRNRGITEINHLSTSRIEELKNLPEHNTLYLDIYQKIKMTFSEWVNFPDIGSWGGTIENIGPGKLQDLFQKKAREGLEILSNIEQLPYNKSLNRVYIPVLRGLRSLDGNQTDFYYLRTKEEYFPNSPTDLEIYTGQTFFSKLTDLLLGDYSDRRLIRDYEEFLKNSFFENQSVSLIPKQETKSVVIKIGREKEQTIANLGDGVQSAIILSFLPFVMQDAAFFFIEEPELYMHPGLQRKILDLFSKLTRHLFFLTTHSNHFLDLCVDVDNVSVFTFRKHLREETGNEEIVPSFIVESVEGGDSSSLKLLGVRNSSVFLVNSTIWVEGITDRWYIRAMLHSYLSHLSSTGNLPKIIEEDLHYCFVEYGGSNITHWSFLDYEEHPIQIKTLCARALVIVDSDGDHRIRRKTDLQEKLGERLIIIPAKEIENLLPYKVISNVIAQYEGVNADQFPKKNWETYRGKPLGNYIEEKILKNQFIRNGGYKTTTGTIKAKVDFCEKACPLIKYEDLEMPVQKMIKDIYEFILKWNE